MLFIWSSAPAHMPPLPAPPHPTSVRHGQFSPRWPGARYIDENGNTSDYDSPSELYTKLTGKPLSGSICTSPEHAPPICYPATTVESFRIWGYTVLGNGEEPPASDPANWLHSNNVKRQSVIDETNIWKEHLKATGKRFVVVNPKWVKKQTPQTEA